MSLLEMTLWGGAMIALLAAVRFAGIGGFSKQAMPWLWCAVLVRLFVPVRWILRMPPSAQTAASLPARAVEAAATTAPTIAQRVSGAVGAAMQAVDQIIPAAPTPETDVLRVLWLAGVGATLVVMACLRLYWRARLAQSIPLASGAPLAPARRKVLLLRCDRIPSPMTAGFFRPKIYLPPGLTGTALRHVLLHEWMHIRHFDVVKKQLMLLALCVHWFNPLVWLMALLMNRDLELACDARTLRALGRQEAVPYAATLLSLAQRQSPPSLTASFAKGSIEERMVNLLNPARKTWVGLLAVAAAIGCCAFAFGEAQANWRDTVKAYIGYIYQMEPYDEIRPMELYGDGLFPTETELSQMLDERGVAMLRPKNLPADCKVLSVWAYAAWGEAGEDGNDISKYVQTEPEIVATEDGKQIHRWGIPVSFYENFDTILYDLLWGDQAIRLSVSIIPTAAYQAYRDDQTPNKRDEYGALARIMEELGSTLRSGAQGNVLPNGLYYQTRSAIGANGETLRSILAVSEGDAAKTSAPQRPEDTVVLYIISPCDVPAEVLRLILESLTL